MTWIADAHRDWHNAHGWDKVCPLDCGVGEEPYDEAEAATTGIRCAHCKGRHGTVAEVRDCAAYAAEAAAWREQADDLAAEQRAEERAERQAERAEARWEARAYGE